jgi:hypothetical protein
MMSSSSNRPVNVSYLVVGLIFLGISGSWALQASGTVDTAQVQWLLPLVLVGAGIVGLVAFAAKGLSRGREDGSSDEPGAQAGFDPYPDETDQVDLTEETEETDPTLTIEGDDR